MNSVANYIQDSYYEVDIISLNDIIERIEPNFLKMDCEGCEFEIIEHCDLSKFNEIIFEHHAKMVGKKYDLLTTKLKKEGFKIKTFKVFDKDFNDIGLIYCYKYLFYLKQYNFLGIYFYLHLYNLLVFLLVLLQ